VTRKIRFGESVRSQPALVGAFLIDAIGTGMFIPFSLLFFLATTSMPLARIGLALSAAALLRIPATVAAGPLSDRFGPRTVIVGSQVLQAAGFTGYLFVHGFWSLVAAAILVQVGNAVFWVAYAPLIVTVAAEDEREHWFALGTALRTAGWAGGAVIAGATVAFGGRDGYIAVAAVNGASFVLAAFLSARVRPGKAAPRPETGPPARPQGRPEAGSGGGWQPLLRDRGFLGFVAVNVGITFVALAVPTALPVFLVKILGLPAWSPGATLALNAILVAVSAPFVMSAISGRKRRNVLMASQACVIVALAILLIVHLLPVGAAVALVLIAILPLAACEVMQGTVVPAVVTEFATPLTLGRYTSAYQVTFSIAEIFCPAVVAITLRVGAAALWLPLAAVALLDIAAVGLLARRTTALRQCVGQSPLKVLSLEECTLEAASPGSRQEGATRH
jgi:MFS family permease